MHFGIHRHENKTKIAIFIKITGIILQISKIKFIMFFRVLRTYGILAIVTV